MSRGWSLLIGVGCLVGAVWATNRTLEYRRHGVVVEGEVISVDAQVTHDSDGLSYWERAVVRYTPKDGDKPRIMKFNWATGLLFGYDRGDKVSVRYLPAEPDAARQDSLLLDWGGPAALLTLGIGGLTGTLRRERPETVLWSSSDD